MTGWTVPGDPMALLPIDSDPAVIGAALFAALNGWRDGLSKKQSDAQTSQAFKMMDEKDWYEVEKRWNFIFTQLKKDRGMIDVTPMDRYETGGYSGSEERSSQCPFEAEALGRAVRKVLDEPDLEKRFEPINSACGGYVYKYDSVVVGRVCRHPDVTAITDLWMILMQRTHTFPNCPDDHDFGVIGFPSSRIPQVPWTGLVEWTGNAFLKTEPLA